MPYDLLVGTSRTCQTIATYGGVATVMDTAQFTLLNPNLTPVIGPLAALSVSTGVYQVAVGPGIFNVPGLWSQVWYVQRSGQSTVSTAPINVGPIP